MAIAESDPTDKLDTEVRSIDPSHLKGRTKNARFMTAQQMSRLTDNIRADGKLTSLPLVYQRPDGELEIISGHHRTKAAIEAGMAAIEVLVITTPVSEDRVVAMQIAHNAVSGQDDRSILAEMYDGLDIDLRRYSGVDDAMLGASSKLDLSSLSIGGVAYQELHFHFLPDDADAFQLAIQRIGKQSENRKDIVA